MNINSNNNHHNHHFPDLDNLEDLVTTFTLPMPISSRSTASLIANGVSLAGISIPAFTAVSLDSLGLLRPLPAALHGLGLADLVCGPGMLSARSLEVYMSMSLGSVLKGPRFHRMESVKLMQYRSNLQYSVYLPYVFFWLASLCHLCRSPLPLLCWSPLLLPLLLLLPLMLVHISSLPLWLIEKRLKYK